MTGSKVQTGVCEVVERCFGAVLLLCVRNPVLKAAPLRASGGQINRVLLPGQHKGANGSIPTTTPARSLHVGSPGRPSLQRRTGSRGFVYTTQEVVTYCAQVVTLCSTSLPRFSVLLFNRATQWPPTMPCLQPGVLCGFTAFRLPELRGNHVTLYQKG